MNILNFVFIGLIFLSLGAIVFIFGRNIKKIRETSFRNMKMGRSRNEEKLSSRKTLANKLSSISEVIKNFFVFVAEWIVKYAKKLLHLVHFWLIKIKKKKNKDEEIDEIEAKRELLSEEQENLNKIIKEDLGSSETENIEANFVSKEIFIEEVADNGDVSRSYEREQGRVLKSEGQGDKPIEKRSAVGVIEEEVAIKEDKIRSFFGRKKSLEIKQEGVLQKTSSTGMEQVDENNQSYQYEENVELGRDDEQGEPRNSFMSFFKRIFKKKPQEEDREELGGELYDGSFDNEGISDGLVRVEKNSENIVDDVVAPKKNKISSFKFEADADEALGVDRRILEKKILQKISKDPKNIENYRQLGELYIKMKNFSDALDAYKYILQVSPRDIDAKRKIEKIKLLKRINRQT